MIGPELPTVDHEQFAKPPLKAMLGQIQFPVILRLNKGIAEVADFQEAIREAFPVLAEEHQIQVSLGPAGPESVSSQRANRYRFSSEDGAWNAVLDASSLALEADGEAEYSSYEQFASHFELLLGAMNEHLKPTKVTRQGMRYVDHIEGEHTPTEWAQWVNPVLLASVADELGKDLARAVAEVAYESDDQQLIFRHGIAQAGPQNALGYLLDFDAVHLAQIEASDTKAVMDRFDEAHDKLYAFFRWCITNKAVEEFRNG